MNPTDQLPLPLPAGRDSARAPRDAARGERPFEIKGSVFSMLSMHLRSDALELIGHELDQQAARMPGFFDVEPLVIDCREAPAGASAKLDALLALMRQRGLRPIGVCNADAAWRDAALAAGLGVMEGVAPAPRRSTATAAKAPEAPVTGSGSSAADAPGGPRVHVVRRTVRTGQRVYAAHGDLTLLSGVNAGAEVLAAGSIHVYAPLRGRALAGVKGDTEARIFTLCMEAELVSVAGTYRVLDRDLPADIRGKPAQIFLDGDKLIIEPLRA
jgi:septum site-determining protein MinC